MTAPLSLSQVEESSIFLKKRVKQKSVAEVQFTAKTADPLEQQPEQVPCHKT